MAFAPSLLAAAVVFLNGHPWRVMDASQDHVALGFYDAAEKGDYAQKIGDAGAFAADARVHADLAIPVRSYRDIRRYFRAHPEGAASIAFFGHGNSAGLYINRHPVPDGTIKLLFKHLQPRGRLVLYCCDLAECEGARAYIRFLSKGQSLLLHWGRIGSEYEYPPWHYTGAMRTEDASDDQLWMLCFTR